MILIATIVWLICGIGAAMVASSKGRDSCGWFFIGFLIGPFALLIVGFMAPASKNSTDLAPDEEVLYSQGDTRVTNRRLFCKSNVYAVKDLRPVEVEKLSSLKYRIHVSNLAGDVTNTISTGNPDWAAKMCTAINQAIELSSLPEPPKPELPNSHVAVDALTEMKRLLDSGLVTQEEYDRKKAEILSRL
jgi:hypothetical protein